jgi:hypothetical protein
VKLSQFHIINENTEDTSESTHNIQRAIHAAREPARQGQGGDLISILESGGAAVRQFVLLPDGTVAEQVIARRVTLSPEKAALPRAEHWTVNRP